VQRSDLRICADLTKPEVGEINRRLDEYNLAQTGNRYHFPGKCDPGLAFNLAVKAPDGAVSAGIKVSSILGVMWLEVLWVGEAHRRRGLASWLILEAERIAYEKGCVGAGTWTFSWQGAAFYPKVGYRLDGIYRGYPLGMTEHVLSKRLPSSDEVRRRINRRVERNRKAGYSLVTIPTEEEMRVVEDGLGRYCVAHAGDEMHNPGIKVRLALRDEEGGLTGGLMADTTIRIIALEALWVDEAWRGLGYGTRLLAEAERIAKDHGCVAAQGSCLSFQSPGFFHKQGYESFGTVDVYLGETTEDLLIKTF